MRMGNKNIHNMYTYNLGFEKVINWTSISYIF